MEITPHKWKEISLKYGLGKDSGHTEIQADVGGITNYLKSWQHLGHFRLAYSLASVKEEDSVLDIGCSSGQFPLFLSEKCKRVFAVEPKHKFPERSPDNTTFLRALGDDLPFEDGNFDKVFCLEVLEHVHGRKERLDIISEMNRVLKKDGKVVITLPIEIGTPLLVKTLVSEALPVYNYRSESYNIDRYGVKDFIKAVVLRRVDDSKHKSHFSFDYRKVLQEVRKFFDIKTISACPFGYLGLLFGTQVGFVAEKKQ